MAGKKNRHDRSQPGVRGMRISVCLPQIIVISSLLIAFRNSGTIGSNINDKSVYCSFIYIYINGMFVSLTSFE